MTNQPDRGLSAITGERAAADQPGLSAAGVAGRGGGRVQETYARWYGLFPPRRSIEKPGAWLTRVVRRLCLNRLASARVRQQTYVGEWIPEPLPVESAGADPADRVTLDESVNMAFLVVLDAMTPAERVAFILHDVFGYPFAEVAEIVGRSDGASRQPASPARRRPRTPRWRRSSTRPASAASSFKLAWEAGDIPDLIGLRRRGGRVLDPDSTAIADGGGRVRTTRHPIEGAERIVLSLLGLFTRLGSMTLLERTVNGQPGPVVQHGASP